MSDVIDTEVAVVGCGPVGALAANLLGLQGVRVLVLERETAEHGQPRAFSCDDEALRIYQMAGLAETLHADMAVCDRIHYTGVNGRSFAEVDFRGLDFGSGYPVLNFFHQQKLERVLRAGLARFPSVELRPGHQVTALLQDREGVTLAVRDRIGGGTVRVRARYVLGCDGGRSATRQLAGIGMSGNSYEEPWLAVSGDVPDEAVRMPDTRFVCDPRRPTFVGKGAQDDYRVELMMLPGETAEEMERPETIARLISPYVDPERIRITRAVVYRFHNAMAEQWKKGRVFLLGDAAHQMPPMMGQGLVSGLRDAANLCWKLALVLRGTAAPALLGSYETERRPHVRAMADASVRVGRVMMGRSRPAAELRDRFFQAIQLVPAVRRFIRRFGFKPEPVYGAGAMLGGRRSGRAAPEGKLFPQAQVETAAGRSVLSDEVLGPGFAVVGVGVDPREAAPEAGAAWGRLGARLVLVLPPDAPAPRPGLGVTQVRDATGRIGEWFRRHGAEVAVVRPDRFVFGAGPAAQAAALAHAAAGTFLAPEPAAGRREEVRQAEPALTV
jgi:3-(3-hydroxy-phenyl)propionate hydroxylase